MTIQSHFSSLCVMIPTRFFPFIVIHPPPPPPPPTGKLFGLTKRMKRNFLDFEASLFLQKKVFFFALTSTRLW